MSSPPHPLMHFGMAGWLKIRDEETAYYKPAKPEESPEWPPKYWKFVLETAEEPKCEAAFVDLRRFARIRLIDCAADQMRNVSPLVENGPDPVIDKDVVTEEWLAEKLGSKRVPVKALLLDQANISGIGNWVRTFRGILFLLGRQFGSCSIDICTSQSTLLCEQSRAARHDLEANTCSYPRNRFCYVEFRASLNNADPNVHRLGACASISTKHQLSFYIDANLFDSDEIMYDARIHPEQYSNTLTTTQIKQLHKSIHYVCSFAVDNLADSSKFPEEWLFKHRWGKGRKDSSTTLPNGSKFVFMTVGGRTSCVVPSVQKKTGPVAGDVKNEAGTEDRDGEKTAKPKGGKKVSKAKEQDIDETEIEPTKKGTNGKKRTVKTEVEEPAVDGYESNGEASKPASKKRKSNSKADTNGAVEPKKQSKAKADTNGVKAKPEPEKSERRRSGRVSGKAA